MKIIKIFSILLAVFSFFGCSKNKTPRFIIETSKGSVKIELDREKAPVTVKNFEKYVEANFYNGTLFHRVIPNFMVQGGGFISGMIQKLPIAEPIRNEANNGLSNRRGTIAMARTPVVDSATSQFFINVTDNNFLNFQNESNQGYGYCVFGKVIEGMDIVDKIRYSPTHTVGQFENVPLEEITILSVKRVD